MRFLLIMAFPLLITGCASLKPEQKPDFCQVADSQSSGRTTVEKKAIPDSTCKPFNQNQESQSKRGTFCGDNDVGDDF